MSMFREAFIDELNKIAGVSRSLPQGMKYGRDRQAAHDAGQAVSKLMRQRQNAPSDRSRISTEKKIQKIKRVGRNAKEAANLDVAMVTHNLSSEDSDGRGAFPTTPKKRDIIADMQQRLHKRKE